MSTDHLLKPGSVEKYDGPGADPSAPTDSTRKSHERYGNCGLAGADLPQDEALPRQETKRDGDPARPHSP